MFRLLTLVLVVQVYCLMVGTVYSKLPVEASFVLIGLIDIIVVSFTDFGFSCLSILPDSRNGFLLKQVLC